MSSPETMSGTEAWIADWQKRVRQCPQVFGVYVRCDGETDLTAIYDCKEAADLHADWYNRNNRNGYLGKAHVSGIWVQTLRLAQERFQEGRRG